MIWSVIFLSAANILLQYVVLTFQGYMSIKYDQQKYMYWVSSITGIVWAFKYTYEALIYKHKYSLDLDSFETKCNIDDVRI